MKDILKSEDISPNTNNFDLIKKIKKLSKRKMLLYWFIITKTPQFKRLQII